MKRVKDMRATRVVETPLGNPLVGGDIGGGGIGGGDAGGNDAHVLIWVFSYSVVTVMVLSNRSFGFDENPVRESNPPGAPHDVFFVAPASP